MTLAAIWPATLEVFLKLIPVKVPQILKIMNAQSAEGINLLGVTLELSAMSATLVYSFANDYPFRWVEKEKLLLGVICFCFKKKLFIPLWWFPPLKSPSGSCLREWWGSISHTEISNWNWNIFYFPWNFIPFGHMNDGILIVIPTMRYCGGFFLFMWFG